MLTRAVPSTWYLALTRGPRSAALANLNVMYAAKGEQNTVNVVRHPWRTRSQVTYIYILK